MSEDDVDLKNALVRSLTENGILPKLQAQLKAAVYLALEKHNYGEDLPQSTQKARSILSTEDGLIIGSLLVDFLTKADLGNTINVLKHEAHMDEYSFLNHEALRSVLNVEATDNTTPVLITLLKSYKNMQHKLKNQDASCSPLDSAKSNSYDHSPQSRKANGIQMHNPIGAAYSPETNALTSSTHKCTNKIIKIKYKPSHDSNESGSSVAQNMSSNCPVDNNSPVLSPGCRVEQNGGINSPRPGSVASSVGNADYGDDFDRSQSSDKTLSLTSRSSTDKNIRNAKALANVGGGTDNIDQRKVTGTNSGTSSPLNRVSGTAPCSETDEVGSEMENSDLHDLKGEESLTEDTVDQTIDSEQSLGLEYVEEIHSLNRVVAATSKHNSSVRNCL